jgi:protocatechuate 3,4-dioxygenase beta subunit
VGHAEIAAYCDGAVVKYADKEISSSQDQPFTSITSGDLVTGIVVPMQTTATAIITVEDPDGRPLAGAKVRFWPNLFWFRSYSTIAMPTPLTTERSLQLDLETRQKLYAEMFSNWYSATTDETGKAVVKNLPASSNGFAVEHEAFQMPIQQTPGGTAYARRNTPIELKPGETTEIHVQMERKSASFLGDGTAAKEAVAPKSEATRCATQTEDKFIIPTTPATPKNKLEGQVVDEDGKPLAGVRVDAWTWCPGNDTQTDSEGRFTLADFDQDQTQIEVRFSKDGYSPVYMFRQPLGKMSQPVVMNNKTYLEGTVTDSSGKPVANALVRADAGPRDAEGVYIGDTSTETHTRADGTYRHYVQHDIYTVTALAGEEMQIVTGVVIAKNEAKRLDMQLAPGPVFRARIVDSLTKQPVAGVQLGNWRWKNIKGVSDANGMVAIAGIPGETFEFDVEGKDAGVVRWWPDQAIHEVEHFRLEKNDWQRNFDSLDFKVTPNMEPVTVIVERGVRIRGMVVDPNGKPVAGATVAPALTGTGSSLTGDTRFSVETGDAGNFDMLLPASKTREYNLIAHDGEFQQWRNWANGVMDPITTQPGDLLEGIKLQLRRPCEVRGQALDEQGKPVVNREVRACAFELNDNGYYVPRTSTDSEGRFDLKYVAPGKHYVQVAPLWWAPTEAPEGTCQIVEVTPEKPAEGVSLTAKPMQ